MAQELVSLVGFAFAASITPGPNNLMRMASGTNYGFRRTLPHLAGVAVGFVLMLLLVGAGLGQLFRQFPSVELLLRSICFAYLLYLAWKLAATRAQPAAAGEGSTGKPLSFLQAALFQWVNPKAWAMALTAMSVYLPSDTLWSALAVALVFGAVNLPCISTWTLLGLKLRAFLHNAVRLKTFNVTMALLLLASVLPVLLPRG
ncbi:MAG: LysE family translocator [Pseudomonadota bacterium]